jgi:hypothetical protein
MLGVYAFVLVALLCVLLGPPGGESLDPSQKARILGEGIAQAMNSVVLGVALWLPSAITLTVLLRKPTTKGS